MAVPDYQTLMLPLLNQLAEQQDAVLLRSLADSISDKLGLSAEDRSERTPSGQENLVLNRLSWARTYLGKAGLLAGDKRGFVRITPRGRSLLDERPPEITNATLDRYPEFVDWLTRSKEATKLKASQRAAHASAGLAGSQTRHFATLLKTFLTEFSEARSQPYAVVEPLWSAASRLRQWLQELGPIADRSSLNVSWSAGKGVWARVPWIAILNRNVTTTTQDGLYCVFLISQDLGSVYLTLAQGVTELSNQLCTSRANDTLSQRAAEFRTEIPELNSAGFKLANDVDLKCEGQLARSYERSVIAYVKFDADNLPDDAELGSYLEPLLTAYDRLASAEPLADVASPPESDAPAWSVDDATDELFLSRAEFEQIFGIWTRKKNLILQGAPGVGPRRVESVQFHQSYGYEDFVQGYRPDGSGGFVLKNGVFYEFCEKARADPLNRYVMIIDEINRGNLSKIFGELMLLIEPDKRSPDWAARLAYSGAEAPRFFVPENLYVVGMMNTADRSLSLVDYALRRRFSFATLEPQFDSLEFRTKLQSFGVSDQVIDLISKRMNDLNERISTDTINLGRGFRIGHSFFVPVATVSDSIAWYRQVVDTEIRPLLDEYWLDDPDEVENLCVALLDGVP